MERVREEAQHELLNHEEMNLVEFPVGLIADRPPIDPETGEDYKTFEWKRWITLPDGSRVQQQWTVAGTKLYGLPRGFDFCVLFLLVQIWSEAGFADRKVHIGTVYRMLRRMGLQDSRQYYSRVRDALKRFTGATYYTRYAIWDTKKRTYKPTFDFNLIDSVSFDSEEVDEELGLCEPSGTVEFTKAFHFLVRRGYLKPTDVERYWRIPTPYGRRLFQFLDKRRINGKVQRFELFSLAKKLGTHDATLKRYKPSDLKRNMEPHLRLLGETGEGYIEGFSWPKEGRRTYLEVRFAGAFKEPRRLSERARALIDEIVDTFDEGGSRRYYECAIDELGLERVAETFREVKAAWDSGRVANPGALFVKLLQPLRHAKSAWRERQQKISACRFCDKQGYLLLIGKDGRQVVHQCPHDQELVRAIETVKGLTRVISNMRH